MRGGMLSGSRHLRYGAAGLRITDDPSLRVVVRSTDEVLELAPAGELDVDTVAMVPELLASVLEDSHAEVRVDLSEVTFADTAAVDGLVRCRQVAEERGRRFVLAKPSRPVRLVLDLLEADGYFSIER